MSSVPCNSWFWTNIGPDVLICPRELGDGEYALDCPIMSAELAALYYKEIDCTPATAHC